MQQIKLFKGVENSIDVLEKEINDWLRQTGKQIVSMTGNIAPQSPKPEGGSGLGKSAFSPSDVLVILLYEDSQ